MCAMLISHMDTSNDNALVSRGNKLDLIISLARILSESGLSDRELHQELMMLQPSWLSSAVSGTVATNILITFRISAQQIKWLMILSNIYSCQTSLDQII